MLLASSKEEIVDMLGPMTDPKTADSLKEAEFVGFQLYRETTILLTVFVSIFGEDANGAFPLTRYQAVCCGLITRMSRFMAAVLHFAADRSHGEIILALNRCILEAAINCEYLLMRDEEAVYQAFIESSLGPERELYDEVNANIAERGGEVLPIERRILSSINRTCKCSGMAIEEVKTKYPQWGINLRERMRQLGKGDLYLHIQRVGSHAVHGTWVDLHLHFLQGNEAGSMFTVEAVNKPDARLLCPIALLTLDSISAYFEKYGPHVAARELFADRVESLRHRLLDLEQVHEDLFAAHKAK